MKRVDLMSERKINAILLTNLNELLFDLALPQQY